jgi:hypothetical protein
MARISARRPSANRRAPTRSSLRQREADRADRHDEWEQKTHEDEVESTTAASSEIAGREVGLHARKASRDSGSGARRCEIQRTLRRTAKGDCTDDQERVQRQPASYDVTKSQPYAIEMAKEGERSARATSISPTKRRWRITARICGRSARTAARQATARQSTRRRRCARRSTKSISGSKR